MRPRPRGRPVRGGPVRRAAGRVLLAATLLGALAAPGAAQQSSTEKEIAESQKRLEQIRRERAQLRDEITRIRSRVHDISSELSLLQRQVTASASLLEELDFQVAQQQEQIRNSTRDLLGTQDRLAERRAILHRRLRDIYKRGPMRTAEALLSAKSFSELLNRYKYLFLVARRDRALMHDVATLEVQMVSRERALRGNLLELERVLGEKAEEHLALANLENEQKRALGSMRARERTTVQRITKLEADEKRLAGLVETLDRKRREAERLAAERRRTSGRRSPPVGEGSSLSTSDLGRLAWPVEGRLLYRFGRAPQANGTVIRWNGIGIGASVGTPVRAVASGTVVMAGPFEGYGPTVILSHGGGYYSLYLYLRDIAVKDGDTVARSALVGTVGGESTPEGAHIEFQIRAPGGQAVDPLAWLRKQGAP